MSRSVLGAAFVGAALAGVGAVATEATANEGCRGESGCIPPALSPPQVAEPYEGSFFLTRAPREADVVGAQIDIEDVTEASPSFYYGKLRLRALTSTGTSTTEELALWWFAFHRNTDRMTARLIPPSAVDAEHPEGETVGTISFRVPPGVVAGVAEHGYGLQQLNDVLLTLNGHASCQLTFLRESGPATQRIPRAKLYDGGC